METARDSDVAGSQELLGNVGVAVRRHRPGRGNVLIGAKDVVLGRTGIGRRRLCGRDGDLTQPTGGEFGGRRLGSRLRDKLAPLANGSALCETEGLEDAEVVVVSYGITARVAQRAIQMARARGILTLLDNSWATPYLFPAFEHGVDVSILAATKYIGSKMNRIS